MYSVALPWPNKYLFTIFLICSRNLRHQRGFSSSQRYLNVVWLDTQLLGTSVSTTYSIENCFAMMQTPRLKILLGINKINESSLVKNTFSHVALFNLQSLSNSKSKLWSESAAVEAAKAAARFDQPLKRQGLFLRYLLRVVFLTWTRMEDSDLNATTLSFFANGSDYQCSGATDEELDLYASLSFWLGGKFIPKMHPGNEASLPPGYQNASL